MILTRLKLRDVSMSRKRKQKRVDGLRIVDIADRGKAVAKDEEGKVYFTDQGVPGDLVDVIVRKKKKSFFESRVVNYQEYSSDRVDPKCDHFGVCGGCKWQHLDYDAQLRYKEKTVINAMTRIGNQSAEIISPIKGSNQVFQYRNKLEYSFSNKRWLTEEEIQSDAVIEQSPALGFHRPGAFDKIVDIYKCHLQEPLTNDIRNFIRDYTLERDITYYDPRNHTGYMRNMILRNTQDGAWMLILSVAKNDPDTLFPMLDAIKGKFPEITSLQYVINQKKNDTILDQDIICYHGEPFIINRLEDVRYKIGPKSFFQTNTKQAEELFKVVAAYAGLRGDENVYDLYTGLGSIALFIAESVGHVVGIEVVEEAIIDARENARYNNIENTTFYAGDVKDILTEEFAVKHGKPDVVITDPPRAGMHADVVEVLLELESPRIVYVSCNPATQARDLDLLSKKYKTIKMQPVDMFPHTHHIENIALLELR